MTSLVEQVGAALKAQGLMLATAESCTGGGIAQAITEVPGSSSWFDRGFVTYSNLSKQQMLGVREETLAQHGAVSEMTVREMVAGALANSAAQVAVAVSGIAGPDGGTQDKPVGTVWFAWGFEGGETQTQRCQFAGNRSQVRSNSVQFALGKIIKLLNNNTETA